MNASGDPGDETANRFRFQWTWAAVVCCMLLDDSEDIAEVFCEHHEDVMLRHTDGAFTGHQVKTRGNDQPLWKAGDGAVRAACVRFAKLEDLFPGRFRAFEFLTNHPLHVAGNGQDLAFVLQSISEAESIEHLAKPVMTWLRKIVRAAGVQDDVAFTAMSKTSANADLPKLHDAGMRLMHTLTLCWPEANECSIEAVERAAQSLIDECGRASSLDHQQQLGAYVIAAIGMSARGAAARIDGKRMTKTRMRAVLERGRDGTAMLEDDRPLAGPIGHGSTDLLMWKLEAGGFSVVSQESALDLRDKAEYLGVKWTKRLGNDLGRRRHEHVRSLVLADAGRAFDAVRTAEGNFGPEMREVLRGHLRERRLNGDQVFDCSIDHLEGVAFSLTAECKLVWSHGRPWESR